VGALRNDLCAEGSFGEKKKQRLPRGKVAREGELGQQWSGRGMSVGGEGGRLCASGRNVNSFHQSGQCLEKGRTW